MKQYSIASTKYQKEHSAAANLREQGYEVYLPKQFIRIEGKQPTVLTKLRFSNYLIVAITAPDQAGHIRNTRDIADLLCRKEGEKAVPMVLPPDWVDEMRRFEDEELARAASRTKPVPRTDIIGGDKVIIDCIDSPFHGQQGELMRVENFIAKVLSGMVIVSIAEADLRKLEQGSQKVA